MDMFIHWGVYKNLRSDIEAKGWILLIAIVIDIVVLAAFTALKIQSDATIVGIAIVSMVLVFSFEHFFLSRRSHKTHEHH